MDSYNTKETVCNGTFRTLKKVKKCPLSEIEFAIRSELKNCNIYPSCQGKPLVYHCTIFENILIEVCAPRVNITGSYCTMYERGLGRVVEDYFTSCSCPFKYNSDKSSEFSECRYTILTNQPIKDDAGNETVSTNKSQSKIAQTPREQNNHYLNSATDVTAQWIVLISGGAAVAVFANDVHRVIIISDQHRMSL